MATKSGWSMKNVLPWFGLSVVIFLIDQITKITVERIFDYGQRLPVLPFFDLTLWYNQPAVDAKGAVVDLGNDVEGYLRASEIAADRVEDARNHLKEGDTVTAMIINVDRKTRSIQLSIKAKDNVEQQEAMQRLSQTSERENAGTTSLGALLRAKLDNNSGNT